MNLKIERLKRGMSQKQLSKLSGVSPSTISRIESGNIDNISFSNLKKISEALEMSIGYLFFDETA